MSPSDGGAAIRPDRCPSRGRDRGAASIYAAVVGLLIVLAGLAVAMRASHLVAAAQAQAAADLGALAGAMQALSGEDPACARAADIATRNGAAVVSCTLDGLDLTLTVQVRDAQSTARAGPVRSTGSDDNPVTTG